MTLKSHSDLNEVGNKGTHERHVVSLEPSDSAFLRGKVKDQLFIDHLLMTDVITLDQHASGERYLHLAVAASVYLTSPKFTGVGGGVRSNTTMYSSGLMKWHRAEKNVRKKWGDEGVVIIHDHIVMDIWTDDDLKIEFLIRILT